MMVEITKAEQNKEKGIKRNEDSFRDLWDNIKCKNIQIRGVQEEEDKRKGYEKILEIIVEKLLNMVKVQPPNFRKIREFHTG